MPPPHELRRVSGEGAIGERHRAVVVDAAAADSAELPEKVPWSASRCRRVVVDAAAEAGGVPGKGDVGERYRAAVIVNAAAFVLPPSFRTG